MCSLFNAAQIEDNNMAFYVKARANSSAFTLALGYAVPLFRNQFPITNIFFQSLHEELIIIFLIYILCLSQHNNDIESVKTTNINK